MNLYEVVFKEKGKGYFFQGHELEIPNQTGVIVETDRGLQYGKVLKKIDAEHFHMDLENLKDILRIATEKDYEQFLKNSKDATSALKNAISFAQDLNLEMKFIDASFTFDRKQLLFNFYAEERIDFRELARKLAGIYKTRIELRQIGARDKAEQIGGIGICGRKLCCASCLQHLESVTMNMAKNQNLALNPSKINGACGRLLCCLQYEDEEYVRCSYGLPLVGEKVNTPYGEGQVLSVDILNRRYKALVDDEIREIELEDEKVS